jgi:hypothetical protein
MKFKLPPQLLKPRFDGSQWITPPEHDGYGLFERPDSELPEIIRVFPGVEILSDEPHWFRVPEGATGLSVEQQNFTADENGYFQAPVRLAPAILYLPGFSLIGPERPLAKASAQGRASEPATTPAGFRTNRAETAEKACERWISELKERPANKPEAFAKARAAVAQTGPLSRKAFDRAWASKAPLEWKEAGSRKRA